MHGQEPLICYLFVKDFFGPRKWKKKSYAIYLSYLITFFSSLKRVAAVAWAPPRAREGAAQPWASRSRRPPLLRRTTTRKAFEHTYTAHDKWFQTNLHNTWEMVSNTPIQSLKIVQQICTSFSINSTKRRPFSSSRESVLGIRIRRIHMFLGRPDPNPLVRYIDPDPTPDPNPSILKQKL